MLHPAIVASGDGSIHGVCLVTTRRILQSEIVYPAWQAQYGKNLPPHVLDAIERARSETHDKDKHGNT